MKIDSNFKKCAERMILLSLSASIAFVISCSGPAGNSGTGLEAGFINGKSLGIVWKSPFRVDVTGALSPGKNSVEIKVTNLWVNRLIGDQQPGIEKKYTYTTQAFYNADSPLLPSGLIGPVQIISATEGTAEN